MSQSANRNINRPVHLARRDGFFEQAVELTRCPLETMETERSLKEIDLILMLFDEAEAHARKAQRGITTPPHEQEFLRFLKLMSENVRALRATLLNQAHFEKEESFLCRFMNCGTDACKSPAMAFHTHASDSLQGLRHILHLALAQYKNLKQDNLIALSRSDQTRYHKAENCLQAEMPEHSD